MNIIDETLAQIPLSELTIKTSINSSAVMERIEYGIMPIFTKRRGQQFFTYEGMFKGNYFKIQSKFSKSQVYCHCEEGVARGGNLRLNEMILSGSFRHLGGDCFVAKNAPRNDISNL